jgi:hypothetical protein
VSLNVPIRQLVFILYLIETFAGAIGSGLTPKEFDAYFRAVSNAQVKGNVFDDLFCSITYDSQELKARANKVVSGILTMVLSFFPVEVEANEESGTGPLSQTLGYQ